MSRGSALWQIKIHHTNFKFNYSIFLAKHLRGGRASFFFCSDSPEIFCKNRGSFTFLNTKEIPKYDDINDGSSNESILEKNFGTLSPFTFVAYLFFCTSKRISPENIFEQLLRIIFFQKTREMNEIYLFFREQ